MIVTCQPCTTLNTTLSPPPNGLSSKWDVLNWYAIHTRSRHEKVLQEELKKKGIDTFLPMRKIVRRWSDRKKIIEEPLFKGYLFAHFPLRKRWDVLNAVGAVRLVGRSNAEPSPIHEREIVSVHRFIENELQVDPFPYLKEGQRVYIRSGPLHGVEGFIVRKDSHCRLVVSLDSILQSVSICIDGSCVEVV